MPPWLVHDRLYKYVLAVLSVPVLRVPPLTGVMLRLPGQSPLAVQVVAAVVLLTVQDIVALLPVSIEVGLTVSETAGGLGSTWTAALSNIVPLLLLHVMV